MNKSLLIFICIIFFALPVFAVEDIDNVNASDEIKLQIEEQNQIVVPQRSEPDIKVEISKQERIENFFDKGLTLDLNGKFIKSVRVGGAYQGILDYDTFQGTSNGSLNYKIPVGDVYILTKFADKHDSEFKFMVNPARTVKGVSYFPGMLQDVYFSTKPTKNSKLLIGNSRTPIGYEGGLSQYTLPFVQRSQISRTYGNTRSVGIKLTTNHKWADANIGLYDSSRYFYHMFQGAEFTGWVNFKPLANLDENKYGKMVIGTGYNVGKRYNSYSVWGTYLEYRYKKFMINAEYAYANGYNGAKNSNAKSNGFYTTVSYRLHPKVEVVGRYDICSPNNDKSHNNRTEISAGINYYAFGNNLKFMLDYVFKLNKDERNSNSLYFLTQFMI